MGRRLPTAGPAILLSTGLVAAFAAFAAFNALAGAPDGTATGAPPASPEMVAALRRDLGLNAEQATARLANDDRAARSMGTLRDELGGGYAGAWLAPDGGRLVVAVTDRTLMGKVQAAGAQPRLVARSEAQLDSVKGMLDRNAAAAPDSVTGWHVDVVTNTVVVSGTGAEAFVRSSGAPAGAVRVVPSREKPRLLADVRGGDSYYINRSGRCSVGFAIVGADTGAGGYVTAGHCGEAGDSTQDRKGNPLGRFAGSSFPDNDYGWVRVGPQWTPRGVVNNYRGGTVRVAGSREAPVGAAVCRSGATTGWHCGTIQATKATVRYPEGTVTGVTRTDVCAEPGDSGGAWLTGNQAQGVTSGGTGDCTEGGTTYFQPVNEILTRYGLKLVTS